MESGDPNTFLVILERWDLTVNEEIQDQFSRDQGEAGRAPSMEKGGEGFKGQRHQHPFAQVSV